MSSGSAPTRGEGAIISTNLDRLRAEIQQLVSNGAESSHFELTRERSLGSGDRKAQADFAKTVQGIANAYPAEERVYVVGADQKERKFYALTNEREFDPANLRQILEKYLEPLPRFEAYVLETDDQVRFAAVVLVGDQPRPIFAKANVQAADGKTCVLQKGDIWIKKNTGLDRASRDDLEAMYETRIEAESERRAAKRFADMRNGMEANLRLQLSPERRIPSKDLVFGPDAEYKAYIEQLLANEDRIRFRMLLTTLHDLLVEEWHSVNAYDPAAARDSEQAAHLLALSRENQEVAKVAAELERPAAKIAEHFQDVFNPALRRLVYAGLLLIKHGSDVAWLDLVADTLVETFIASEKLLALQPAGSTVHVGRPSRGTVALEVLLGGRVLADYATRAARYIYLPALLRKYVVPVGSGRARPQKPLLFWPLPVNVPGNDRIAYMWDHVVQPYWLPFFGSEESYLDAACRLEFILHLNSYLSTQFPEVVGWLNKFEPDKDFSYWYTSDLWRYSLNAVVPLAESIYENLAMGPTASFLLDLSIVPAAFQSAFQPTEEVVSGHEQEIFVEYLRNLMGWQAQAALSAGRFSYQVDWGPVLGPAIGGK